MKNFLLGCLAVLAIACTPAKAETIKKLDVRVVTHQSTHWVVGFWKNAPITDGLGPLTNLLTWNKIGTDSTGHILAPTATVDSFQFTANVGTPVSGSFCVRAQRRALLASASCKAWTFNEQDQPPPASVIDSLRTAGVFRPIGSGTIQVMATGETCTYTNYNYYQQDFAMLDAGQSQACSDAFDRNLKAQSDFAFAAAVHTRDELPIAAAKWDSAAPNPYPQQYAELPRAILDTHFEPRPMSGDTFVAMNGSVVAIADYRTQHPGFTWP